MYVEERTGIAEGEMRTLMIDSKCFCQRVGFLLVVLSIFFFINNAINTLIIMIVYPFKWYLDGGLHDIFSLFLCSANILRKSLI